VSLKISLSGFLKTALMFSLLIGFGSVISMINPLISDGLTTILAFTLLVINKEIKVNIKLIYSLLFIYVFTSLSALLTGSNIFDYFGVYFRITIIFIIITAFQNNYNEIKHYLIKALWIVTYLAILNFILTILIPSSFSKIVSEKSGYTVATFGFLFNYLSTISIEGFEVVRNQSIFWEPGVLQIPMNILVYYILLEQKKKITSAFLPIIVILTTFSTTGFIILIYTLVRAYWNSFSLKGKGFVRTFMVFVFLSLFLSLMLPVISAKFTDEDHKASSISRQYDMLMSAIIIKENPIVGIGINENNYFKAIENKSVDSDGFVVSEEHGNTNTVVSVFMKFGIPLSLVFFYFLFNQNIFTNKYDFFLIIILSLMSEPLLVVYFVLLLLMSSVKLSRLNNKKQL